MELARVPVINHSRGISGEIHYRILHSVALQACYPMVAQKPVPIGVNPGGGWLAARRFQRSAAIGTEGWLAVA